MMADKPAAPGTTAQDETIGGVECVVCRPAAPTSTVLYLHGGGYRLGAARSWVSFATSLAAAADTQVVIVDYRLAPEHPFPAALHDAAAVFDAVGGRPRRPPPRGRRLRRRRPGRRPHRGGEPVGPAASRRPDRAVALGRSHPGQRHVRHPGRHRSVLPEGLRRGSGRVVPAGRRSHATPWPPRSWRTSPASPRR